jgi:7-cyano-7-deazaguanine synthase in queuosine biosynthesis
LRLRLGDGREDVHLQLEHITRQMRSRLPDVVMDLIEIAAFVYVADQCVRRGGKRSFDYGKGWFRRFRFEVPVRRPDVWGRTEVSAALVDALQVLSDDHFEFGFGRLGDPPPVDRYLYDDIDWGEPSQYQEVVLFSGGQDSLAGAVQEILQGQRKIMLVSHRPNNKVYGRQQNLVRLLAKRLPDAGLHPWHVAVRVSKHKHFGAEFTLRTRSFLFAAVAAAVAGSLGLRGIRFFENGVVSMNLPVSPQVIGARASRTTHPQVLRAYEKLFSLLFDGPFRVDNPFVWKTRAEILREAKAAKHADLFAQTVSCVHTKEATRRHPHCGRCSQCVDRRLGALAADLDDSEDPPDGYACDVLTGPREGNDLTLLERYYGSALEVDRMRDPAEFLAAYGEAGRMLAHVGLPAAEAAERVFALHKRHAEGICGVLARAVKDVSDVVVRRQQPANCLLSIALGRTIPARRATTNGPPNGTPEPRAALEFPEGTFEVRVRGKSCFLGNTLEYRFLERLASSLGRFVAVSTLYEEVWGDSQTGKNAVQRVCTNLRRQFRNAGIAELRIDGKQVGHYRLVLTV